MIIIVIKVHVQFVYFLYHLVKHTPLHGLQCLPHHSSSQQDKGSNLRAPDHRYGSYRYP